MTTRNVVTVRLENDNRRTGRTYFCELVADGRKVLETYGNASPADTKITDRRGARFATHEAAVAEVERLAAERRRSFKTVTRTEAELPAVDDTLAPATSNPALEAELLRGEAAAGSVYADWLQAQGDVRGELAALWIAGKADAARQWIADHAVRVFGELDVKLDHELYDLVWTNGFLAGASMKRASMDSDTKLGTLVRTFVELPVARHVTALRFGLASYESDNDWTETMRAVATWPRAGQLRSLRFDDYSSEDCELSWTPFGDFSFAWPALAGLEELVVRSGQGGTLGQIDLPNLRTFTRISGGLSRGELDEIIAARWPRLERLEVWFGREDYGAGGTIGQVEQLLAKLPPALVHLGLVNCELTHELVPVLARSPALARLRALDLTNGVLMTGDVDELVKHADAFRHLDQLVLDDNLLDPAGMAAIRAVLPNASVAGTRYDGDDRRYAAVGE